MFTIGFYFSVSGSSSGHDLAVAKNLRHRNLNSKNHFKPLKAFNIDYTSSESNVYSECDSGDEYLPPKSIVSCCSEID